MEVKETALSDFYARVVIDETGRINLQDLVKPAPGAPQGATNSVATGEAGNSASGQNAANLAAGAPVVRIGAISRTSSLPPRSRTS